VYQVGKEAKYLIWVLWWCNVDRLGERA